MSVLALFVMNVKRVTFVTEYGVCTVCILSLILHPLAHGIPAAKKARDIEFFAELKN